MLVIFLRRQENLSSFSSTTSLAGKKGDSCIDVYVPTPNLNWAGKKNQQIYHISSGALEERKICKSTTPIHVYIRITAQILALYL